MKLKKEIPKNLGIYCLKEKELQWFKKNKGLFKEKAISFNNLRIGNSGTWIELYMYPNLNGIGVGWTSVPVDNTMIIGFNDFLKEYIDEEKHLPVWHTVYNMEGLPEWARQQALKDIEQMPERAWSKKDEASIFCALIWALSHSGNRFFFKRTISKKYLNTL